MSSKTFVTLLVAACAALFALGCERPPESESIASKKPTSNRPSQDLDIDSVGEPAPSGLEDGGAPWGPEVDWQAGFDQDAPLSSADAAQFEAPIAAQFDSIAALKTIEPLKCKAVLCRIVIEVADDEERIVNELSKPNTPVNELGMTFASRQPGPAGKVTIVVFLHRPTLDVDALPRRVPTQR